MKNSNNTHFAYGIGIAIAMIILNVVLYVTSLSFKPWAQWVGYIPFIVGLILNAQAFAKSRDNYVSFGQVFSSCFKACAIITLILLVWGFVSLLIFPGMIDKGMEIARQRMAEKSMSEEQVDQAMEMTRKYFKLFMVAGIVFGTMFFGAIFSVISAAVTKKKGVNPSTF